MDPNDLGGSKKLPNLGKKVLFGHSTVLGVIGGYGRIGQLRKWNYICSWIIADHAQHRHRYFYRD